MVRVVYVHYLSNESGRKIVSGAHFYFILLTIFKPRLSCGDQPNKLVNTCILFSIIFEFTLDLLFNGSKNPKHCQYRILNIKPC